MICSLADLRGKEVINIINGEKLGFVDDVEIDTEKSTLISLIIYGRERFWGFFGRDDDLVIACKDIKLIGKDTILISKSADDYNISREKGIKNKSFSLENLYK